MNGLTMPNWSGLRLKDGLSSIEASSTRLNSSSSSYVKLVFAKVTCAGSTFVGLISTKSKFSISSFGKSGSNGSSSVGLLSTKSSFYRIDLCRIRLESWILTSRILTSWISKGLLETWPFAGLDLGEPTWSTLSPLQTGPT